MGKTIKLASVLLKCGLGTGAADDQKKRAGSMIGSPLLLILLLPVIYYLYRGGMILWEIFGSIDEDGLMLGFLLFALSAFIFCTGIAACINSFYLSSNLNSLLVMPFTSGQITGAKFAVAAIYEYGISFTVLAPVLAGYGYAMAAPASYWAGAVLAVLVLPLAPLAYAAVVSMIVMRFIGGAKNKDRMMVLGAVGAFVFMTLYQIIRESTRGMKINAAADAVAHLAKTLKGTTAIFPDIPFLTNVMAKGEWLSVLWSLLTVTVILAVFQLAGRYLYLSGAVGMQDTSVSHKKLTEEQIQKNSRVTNIVWSYTRKELRTILRTPAYYTGCLFLTLGWPLILILPACFSKAEQKEAASLEGLLLHAESPIYDIFLLFCIVYGVTVLAASLNGIAVSAISREGKSFYIMRQLPVPYRKQLQAKQYAALIICGIGSGGYLLIGAFLLMLLEGFPWWYVFPVILFNIPLLYIIVDLEMIFGFMRPNLAWESEGDVVSKNRTGFVLFLLGIVAGCVFIYGLNDWVRSLACSPLVFTAGLCSILAVLAFAVNRIFYLYGEKRLEQL